MEGMAKVTIDKEVKFLSQGESVFVPLGAIHRLENSGELPMLLIEVQLGPYLGEDTLSGMRIYMNENDEIRITLKMHICVVGLGYVGLPLCIELAKHFAV